MTYVLSNYGLSPSQIQQYLKSINVKFFISPCIVAMKMDYSWWWAIAVAFRITIAMVQSLNDGRTYADSPGFSFVFSPSNDSGISRVIVILINTALFCIFLLFLGRISVRSIPSFFVEMKWRSFSNCCNDSQERIV